MAERGTCRCCGNEYNINGDGTVRYHLTDKAECQATPGSRKCSGVGQKPAGAEPEVAGQLSFLCRVPSGPSGCGHQVQLTANHRARSHLTPHGEKCAEGSSAPPIAVGPEGFREDTADWTEERWAEMLPAPKPERGGEVLPAAAPEDLRFGSEDAVEDFLGTGGPIGNACAETGPKCQGEVEYARTAAHRRGAYLCTVHRAAAAGDGRTAAQQEEIDRRMADPVGSALERLLSPAVGDPGTVLDAMDDATRIKALPPDERGPAVDALFDVTHDFSDDATQTYGVHPGPADGCTMPECCTHPQGFVYGDDDNGHSGEECPLCGAEPPAPCNHYYVAWDDWDEQNGTECITWACLHCGHPEPDDETEAALPERAQCPLSELDEGDLFRRHTRPEPVGSLVFRVAEHESPGVISATVVSAGPYADRTGPLTDLQEMITCTDLDGAPRPRRVSGPEAVRPTWKPQPPSSKTPPSEPSPSKTGPARGSTPSTTASVPPAGVGTSSPATASGPTATAVTSTRTALMTSEAQAAGDFLAAASGSHGEAEARYGRWGRYKLTHPVTGRTVEWTRATTFAKSISDTYTLSQWAQRNVLVGATLRPDIVAAAHGKDVSKDREQLNTWTEELQQAAGSKVAANLGTAVHSFTERVDRRWKDRWDVYREDVPDEFKPHVRAYIMLLEEYGLEPVPHMIEFSTGVLQYEVMGTSDNCYRATKHLVLKMPRGEVRLSPGEHVIGDKKTGKDLDYGWQEICIQLALYAQGVNTQGIFNWADLTWDADPLSRFAEPGTKVREDVGVILHLPVDPRSTKKPAIHGVDLESGWNAVVLCERVRVWRKLRNLAGPVAVVDEDPLASGQVPAPAAVRPPTIWERAEAVTSKPEASAVYQDAVADKMPVADVEKLIVIMSEKIAQVAEPGGAKV